MLKFHDNLVKQRRFRVNQICPVCSACFWTTWFNTSRPPIVASSCNEWFLDRSCSIFKILLKKYSSSEKAITTDFLSQNKSSKHCKVLRLVSFWHHKIFSQKSLLTLTQCKFFCSDSPHFQERSKTINGIISLLSDAEHYFGWSYLLMLPGLLAGNLL
jgi:hypothetical protein